MTHDGERVEWSRLLTLILLVIFVVGGPFGYLLISTAEKDRDVERSDIAACQRGNLQRAYELSDPTTSPFRRRLARDVIPIINCPRAIREGAIIPVDESVQREYVRLMVVERVWPILGEDGEIERTKILPSVAQGE